MHVSSRSNEEIAIIYELKLFCHQFTDDVKQNTCIFTFDQCYIDIKYGIMFVVFKNVINSPLYRFGNII